MQHRGKYTMACFWARLRRAQKQACCKSGASPWNRGICCCFWRLCRQKQQHIPLSAAQPRAGRRTTANKNVALAQKQGDYNIRSFSESVG
jgi:hypothetical protein